MKILVFCAAFLAGLTFALYTDRAWEDWYITCRAGKNLATGNGLVYTIGEQVHSFTLPLGTLTPALFNYLTHNPSDALMPWLYRVFGCLLLGAPALLSPRAARQSSLGRWATIILVKVFDVRQRIDELAFLPGRSGLRSDGVFIVYRWN